MRLSSFNFIFVLFLIVLGAAASLRAQSIITTIAGGGPVSYMGNGGPATLANIGGPDDIALDSHGSLFIADPGNLLIRKVDMTTGIITTVAGDSTFNPGYSGDGGPATLAEFNYPSGIAFDPHDNLYISDYYNSVVRRVDALTGIITTVVGTGVVGYSGDGGPATLATLNAPLRLRFDPSGDLLIADSMNGAIRRVNMTTGIITTYAGTGILGYSGDGGPATLATMAEPQGMDFDSAGNLYVTDSDNHVVRKIDRATGIITTIAGNGTIGYSGDGGPATLASFSAEPDGILVGCNNNIYVTDDLNNTIRVISGTTGIITTMAGDVTVSGGVTTGIPGHSGDGGSALGAKLDHPEALIFGSQGSMLVADYIEGYIRQISVACALTPTWTSTFTNTPTFTLTPTPSPTPSPTKTFTPTPTWTNTPTLTPTPTDSPTPTNSPTITPTPTSTWTQTSTGTPTPSGTPTATGTSTASSTPTLTFTSTWTASATPTATWVVSLGKQASKTEARSGDTVTYTLAVTVGTGNLSQPLVVDTLPAGLSFLSMGAASNGSAQYIPALNQIQWTLSSPLGPGSYSLTYQAQLRPFTPADQDLINNAQLTYTGLGTPLRASASVLVPGVFTVRIGIYNEAGEWIQDLTSFRSTQPVNSLDLIGGPISSLTGNGNHIDLYSQGSYLATWNGLNAQGDPLTNGVYQIKVENVDSFGSVTTVTRNAVITRNLARVTVQIFNEAGEVVKHLFAFADDASGAQMTNLVLSGSVVDPHGSGGANGGVTLVVNTSSSSSVTLTWDGTNDVGSLVTAGHYEVMAHWSDGKGGSSDITRGIQVAPHGDPAQNWVWAQPNRLSNASGNPRTVFSSTHSDWSLTIRIYDLAGELVAQRTGLAGTLDTTWDTSNQASGLYLAHVEGRNAQGGLEGAQTLKLLVVH